MRNAGRSQMLDQNFMARLKAVKNSATFLISQGETNLEVKVTRMNKTIIDEQLKYLREGIAIVEKEHEALSHPAKDRIEGPAGGVGEDAASILRSGYGVRQGEYPEYAVIRIKREDYFKVLAQLEANPAPCHLCEKGFPVEGGEHYGTQALGMIAPTACAHPAPSVPQIPEGYVIVPVEPTGDMKFAGSECANAKRAIITGVLTCADAHGIYNAMIAAAPKPDGGVE